MLGSDRSDPSNESERSQPLSCAVGVRARPPIPAPSARSMRTAAAPWTGPAAWLAGVDGHGTAPFRVGFRRRLARGRVSRLDTGVVPCVTSPRSSEGDSSHRRGPELGVRTHRGSQRDAWLAPNVADSSTTERRAPQVVQYRRAAHCRSCFTWNIGGLASSAEPMFHVEHHATRLSRPVFHVEHLRPALCGPARHLKSSAGKIDAHVHRDHEGLTRAAQQRGNAGVQQRGAGRQGLGCTLSRTRLR